MFNLRVRRPAPQGSSCGISTTASLSQTLMEPSLDQMYLVKSYRTLERIGLRRVSLTCSPISKEMDTNLFICLQELSAKYVLLFVILAVTCLFFSTVILFLFHGTLLLPLFITWIRKEAFQGKFFM